MKRVLVFLMTLSMLVSCASPPARQQVADPISPHFTSPTAVMVNSIEPTSTYILVPTETVEPTQELFSFPSATETALSFLRNDYTIPGKGKGISPDGKWRAFTDNGFEVAHAMIARLDGEKSWDLSFQDITGESSCMSYTDQYGDNRCFYGVLYLNHWYKNGRYVFIDADYLIDRSTNFHFGQYRIDSETDQVSTYLPLNGYGYSYAFSPDDEYYSYASGIDNELLHVVSIETGENISHVVPGRYEDIGEMLWTPDNERVAIVTHGIGWSDTPEVGWSLMMLDVGTGEFTTLIPNEGYRLTPKEWLSNDTLLLSGRSKEGQEYHDYQLTISTNTLLPLPDATPTP